MTNVRGQRHVENGAVKKLATKPGAAARSTGPLQQHYVNKSAGETEQTSFVTLPAEMKSTPNRETANYLKTQPPTSQKTGKPSNAAVAWESADTRPSLETRRRYVQSLVQTRYVSKRVFKHKQAQTTPFEVA